MSPELRAEFEARWPALSARLDRFLANRRVPPGARDDLIQETAIRLFGVWPTVDRSRSPWPLTVTIALNLLRDDGRAARNREFSGEVPETFGTTHEVEAAGLARVELARVAAALEQLPALQRAALMREIGINGTRFTTREAEKMLRLRARKRLRTILERVPSIFVLRLRRDPADLNAVLVARDGLTQMATCLACAVLGIAAGVVPGIVAPAEASAAGRSDAVLTYGLAAGSSISGDALDVPHPAAAAVDPGGGGAAAGSGPRARSASEAVTPAEQPPGASVPATMPLPEDVPLQPPGVEPPATEPPPLPRVPPVTPPQDDDAPLQPADLVEDAVAAVATDL